jgi:hypothetical protein
MRSTPPIAQGQVNPATEFRYEREEQPLAKIGLPTT